MDSLKLRLCELISHLFAQNVCQCSLTTFGELDVDSVSHFVKNYDRIFGKEVLYWMIFTHLLQFQTKCSLLFFKIFDVEVFLRTRILHQFVVILHMP